MLKREEAIETLKSVLEDLESIYPFDDYTSWESEGKNCGLRTDNKALWNIRKVIEFLES